MRQPGWAGRRACSGVLAGVVALLLLPTSTASAVPPAIAPVVAPVESSVGYEEADDGTAPTDAHDDAVQPWPEIVTPEWTTPVVQYVTTARFGDRGRHWTTRHTGLDYKAPWGTPVYAVHDGTVLKLAWHHAYGRMVLLEVAPGVVVWYCHLSAVTVGLGPVHMGDELGRIGMSGNATGPHLHLEVRVDDRPTDPETYLVDTPGVPGAPPSWLPPVPIITVANLSSLTHPR